LKVGRHFRLDAATKIVVGRTQKDNKQIRELFSAKTDQLIKVIQSPGPLVLVPDGGEADKLTLAATICAGYSKAPNTQPADVSIEGKAGRSVLQVLGLPPKMFQHLLI
jgi:hypothetical protein